MQSQVGPTTNKEKTSFNNRVEKSRYAVMLSALFFLQTSSFFFYL